MNFLLPSGRLLKPARVWTCPRPGTGAFESKGITRRAFSLGDPMIGPNARKVAVSTRTPGLLAADEDWRPPGRSF